MMLLILLAFSLLGITTGMGSQLSVYDVRSGGNARARLVWEGVVLYPAAIWAIRLYGKGADLQVLVIGQKRACLLSHKQVVWGRHDDCGNKGGAFTSPFFPRLYVNWQMEFCDWVLDILPITHMRARTLLAQNGLAKSDFEVFDDKDSCIGSYFVIGFAHNFIEVWQWKTGRKIYETKSEPCILYSMSLFDDELQSGSILAASGTMFSRIIIWDILKPFVPAYSLEGHEGVIFGIKWNKEGCGLISFSDDRSLRVWELPDRQAELPTTTKQLSPSVSMHGHEERIWDVCFIGDELIASVSEDSTGRIWSTKTGACLASLRGHQGRNIWRVAVNHSKSILATGGGDSAIRLWPIESIIQRQSGGNKLIIELPKSHDCCNPSNHKISGRDFIRRLKLLGSHQLLIATDRGTTTVEASDTWNIVYKLESGRTWESIVTSPNHRFVLLGDDKGYLTLINLAEPGQIHQWHAHEGKIRFTHWPQTDDTGLPLSDQSNDIEFFTTGLVDSKMKWWKINLKTESPSNFDHSKSCHATYSFPLGVTICSMALSITLGIVLCGDSKGKMYVLSLEEPKILQIINAHGHDRVSDIVIRGPKVIYSTSSGRSGCLNRYSYFERLSITSITKMSRILEGIERILLPKQFATSSKKTTESVEDELFLFGIRGADMVALHVQTKCQSLQIDCGRSKRAWDLDYKTTPDGPFTLVYHGMDKKIHVHVSLSTSATEFPILGIPFHARETNALRFLPMNPADKFHNFVTCSVDTTSRLWRVSKSLELTTPTRIDLKQILREHSSNVKDIAVTKSSTSDNTTLLFSGGGHCSIHCWLLGQQTTVVHGGSFKKHDSEARVMGLDVLDISNGLFLLSAGTSAGDISLILYDEAKRSFKTLASLQGHLSTVLSVHFLPAQDKKEPFVLLSGGTDGQILFWNLTPLMCVKYHVLEQLRFDDYSQKKSSNGSSGDARPFHVLRAHQSGVNTLSIQRLPHALVRYIVVSGGDDQALNITTFSLEHADAQANLIIDEHAPRKNSELLMIIISQLSTIAHSSAVKGVKIIGSYIFTSGPDQRLNIWRIKADNSIAVELVGYYFLDVADIAALDVVSLSSILNEPRYLVAVAGVGTQLLQIELRE